MGNLLFNLNMKDTIYLSVFGLNLALINELKAIINIALQEKYEISWTHLADSKLQLLLINEDFINIPHIEQMDKKKSDSAYKEI